MQRTYWQRVISIKTSGLILRPNRLPEQQITRLDQFQIRTVIRSDVSNRLRPRKNKVVSPKSVLMETGRKRMQFCITERLVRLNDSDCLVLDRNFSRIFFSLRANSYLKPKNEIDRLSSLQKFLQIRSKTKVSSKNSYRFVTSCAACCEADIICPGRCKPPSAFSLEVILHLVHWTLAIPQQSSNSFSQHPELCNFYSCLLCNCC